MLPLTDGVGMVPHIMMSLQQSKFPSKYQCRALVNRYSGVGSTVHFDGTFAVANSRSFSDDAGFVGQLGRSISKVMKIMKTPMIAQADTLPSLSRGKYIQPLPSR